MFYSVFFFLLLFFSSLLKDTGAADRWVIVTLSGEIKIQTKLGAELGKAEFRGIFSVDVFAGVRNRLLCFCILHEQQSNSHLHT